MRLVIVSEVNLDSERRELLAWWSVVEPSIDLRFSDQLEEAEVLVVDDWEGVGDEPVDELLRGTRYEQVYDLNELLREAQNA